MTSASLEETLALHNLPRHMNDARRVIAFKEKKKTLVLINISVIPRPLWSLETGNIYEADGNHGEGSVRRT